MFGVDTEKSSEDVPTGFSEVVDLDEGELCPFLCLNPQKQK